MRNRHTKLFEDERGAVFTVVLLFILPMLIYMMISSSYIARSERVTNETLQEAISNSVTDAAHMVDRESQAMGEPRIDYERAHARFIESLEFNLNLLNGGDASSVGDYTYWLIVYNGDDKYKGYKGGKVASYAYFTNDGGSEYISDSIQGFPHTLDISDNGFYDGGLSVTMDSPSVVAIVTTKIKGMNNREADKVSRWAQARIVEKE